MWCNSEFFKYYGCCGNFARKYTICYDQCNKKVCLSKSKSKSPHCCPCVQKPKKCCDNLDLDSDTYLDKLADNSKFYFQ